MSYYNSNDKSYPQLNNTPQFHEVDHIFTDRLRQFTDNGGQYVRLNLPKFYDRDRFSNSDGDDQYVKLKVYTVPNLQRPLFKEVIPAKLDEFKPTSKGATFGPGWATFWFHVHYKFSQRWIDANQRIVFEFDCNNELLIYDKDGVPQQAITGGGERTEFIIPESWREDTDEHEFFVEMACNGMFGGVNGGSTFRLNKLDFILPNVEAHNLSHDFHILGDAARELNGNSWQKHKARDLCNQIMDVFDPEDESTILKCRALLKSYLGEDIDSEKVFQKKVSAGKVDVYAVGNCHIDTAWLWPFAETKRKIVRSWTTQLKLMDDYPEYKFVASQAQQFKWLKMYHPEIFDKVKLKIQENQFFPIGGSWVENDTNMPSGESLARQFLLGQRYFLDNFGFKSDCFWLPDTFGYSSQIPQLCRLAGMPNFVTQKLSWNNINRFPHSTFNWVAIDGSQVLCHMPPLNTYTADANFGDVNRSLKQHLNLSTDQSSLLLYGKGDGGGGPNPGMLERLRRCRGLSNTVGSDLPVVEVGKTIPEFFENVLETSKQGTKLPSWKGELYLEFHRGTYTTQAFVKKNMRASEILLHDLEYLATLTSLYYPDDYTYPLVKIYNIWEDICLCQFHDVLPGSCIGMVYNDEVKPIFKRNFERLQKLFDEVFDVLKKNNGSKSSGILNTLPWKRSGVVAVDLENANKLKPQQVSDGKAMLYVESDASNLQILKPISSKLKYLARVVADDDYFILTNDKLKATIDKNGVIKSLIDLINGDREIIDLTGKNKRGANQLVLFDDQPLTYQAWDTELYSLEKFKYIEDASSIEVLSEGPIVASVKVTHNISNNSSISTIISIEGSNDESGSRLNFHSEVDWHETYKFLKVEFPVDINLEYANYETQFGLTKRPTHYNTSWDTAKFEVCHHKFADYSDFNYGVSILNDCKYGFSVHGNLMRLSLLRAPKYPDGDADMGHHEFRYAIYPHKGPLGADTVKQGYEFNDRLHEFVGKGVRSMDSNFLKFVSMTGPENVILSNVKRGDDDYGLPVFHENIPKKFKGHKTVILRLYESLGGKTKLFVNIDLPIKKVFKCNLLEEELEELSFDKKGFEVELRGFEVASYRVVL